MVNIIIVCAIAVQGAILFLFWYFVFRREIQMIHTYPLYAVRDKFIALVASGSLREDDKLFQEFYKSINIIIPNSKAITIRRLVESVEDARKKGYDPTDEQRLKEITEQLKSATGEVREAVDSFYGALLLLMLKNSPVLWLAAKVHFATIPRITKFQKSVGGLFDRVQNAKQAVRFAC